MKWESKTARDVVMFGAGFLGFGHEVIVTQGERPTLLLACLALMGVPFFLRKDEDDEQPTQPLEPPTPPSEQLRQSMHVRSQSRRPKR